MCFAVLLSGGICNFCLFASGRIPCQKNHLVSMGSLPTTGVAAEKQEWSSCPQSLGTCAEQQQCDRGSQQERAEKTSHALPDSIPGLDEQQGF